MDCLQDWPEPVVRVQSLSEGGAAAIPARYVKPPSERPGAADHATYSTTTTGGGVLLEGAAAPAAGTIPVVDLAGLAGDAGTCRETMRAVWDACREWGFFQVVNHGVSPGLMRRAREAWRGFFRLPMAAKQAYANSPRTYEGYGSRLGVEEGAPLDWGDYFFLHLLPESIKNHGKWPSQPPSCRETAEEYGGVVVELCRVLMRVMSMGLGLDVGYLQRAFGGDDEGACMRVNYYPRCPQPDLTLGLSAHSDPGGLTVLLPDDRVGGLQVRRGDAWVAVRPLPDSLVVNVGDQIQVLSNGLYRSVEHRAVVNAAEERISLALFYNPRSDLPIGPARELATADRPPLYRAMTFDEYRRDIRKKGPRGKAQALLLLHYSSGLHHGVGAHHHHDLVV